MPTLTPRLHAGLIALLALAPISSLAAQTPKTLRSPSAGVRMIVPTTPPVGPPPQNAAIDASATYGVMAKVVWTPTSNAASFVVTRRMLEDPACCNATSGVLPPTASSWTDTGLLKKGTYMFKVTVNYTDGSVGSTESGIAGDGVRNPSPVTVTDVAPGQVQLDFSNNIRGTSLFALFGPGLALNSVTAASTITVPGVGTGRLMSSGPFVTGILPAGTHTWQLASVYSNNLGILSPPAEFTQVTHTVSIRGGRYRISLERFQAIAAAPEDLVRSDGRGNEVYITTQVNEYGVNRALLSSRMVRTPTFGDVQNYPNRVRAGSVSPTGGIQATDEYPAAVQYINQLAPASTANLPYLLWEGDLTELDGLLLLSPAIWEADEDERLLLPYINHHAAIAANASHRTQFQLYAPRQPGGRLALDNWNPVRSCPTTNSGASTVFVSPLGSWGDEPVDMNRQSNYCPMFVAINWRLANSLTTVNPASVVEVPFPSPASYPQYKLFMRIEKVAPTAVVAPASFRSRTRP